jgi:hypothetical protein
MVGEVAELLQDLVPMDKLGEAVEKGAGRREDRLAFPRRNAATTASRFSSKMTD